MKVLKISPKIKTTIREQSSRGINEIFPLKEIRAAKQNNTHPKIQKSNFLVKFLKKVFNKKG